MAGKELKNLHILFDHYKHRDKRTDSDCSIVEHVWLLYRNSKDDEVRSTALVWFLARIEDKKTNELARTIICWNLYRNRKTLSHKERKRFRQALRYLPRNRRKVLKRLAR